MTGRILTAAIGGALLLYGFIQRANSKESRDNLKSDIARSEGWLGIGLGSLLVLAALLSGCATSSAPPGQRYRQLEWAKMSAAQAEAECYAEVQKNPLLGFPTCMRARGWQER